MTSSPKSPAKNEMLKVGPKAESNSYSILITECLQHDFIGLNRELDPHPNSLHVGPEETMRLIGDDPEIGPLKRMMNWARSQHPGHLQIIHIREWHNPKDLTQTDHLDHFGIHCVADTPGADLVLGLGDEVAQRKNEMFVNVTGLNDFEGTGLQSLIENAKAKVGPKGTLRIGVIGVWTEAKVLFLLYELKTRLKLHNLATCAALTAGSDRLKHFSALAQIEKLFNVQVKASVTEFTDWLLPGGKKMSDLSLTVVKTVQFDSGMFNVDNPAERKSKFVISGVEEKSITSEDIDILRQLFRTCSQIHLTKLGGGFSGASVFKAKPTDEMGHKLAPCVVKIGPTSLVTKEKMNFERVEEILGNNAPRMKGFIENNKRAGIKFAYASMLESELATFKDVFRRGANKARLNTILNFVFEEILGRFYAVSQLENCNLLDCYNFDGKGWAYFKGGSDNPEKVKERILEILPDQKSDAEFLKFGKSHKFENVALFLEKFLPTIPRRKTERHYVSYVHGDLNGSNIILDGNNNVWLIDFFFTERTHVLKDISKVENDILMIYTDVNSEEELEEGLLILDALADANDLGQLLPEELPNLTTPHMIRAYHTCRELRKMTLNLVKQDRNPLQLQIALLRYALFNLCLDEVATPLQRKFSLAASCIYAESIKKKYQKERAELFIYWTETKDKAYGNLGITLLPGRTDRGRDLKLDVQTLLKWGVKRVVNLAQTLEMEECEVLLLGHELEKNGIKYHHSPTKDQSIPSVGKLLEAIDWIIEGLKNNENVIVCCVAGLGRSGCLAACTLVALQWFTPRDAIVEVRRARGTHRAIERTVQEKLIENYQQLSGSVFLKKKMQLKNI